MNTLILGGTGLISTGIVAHLVARGAAVTVYNRNQRTPQSRAAVTQIVGDRSDREAFEQTFARARYDVVIDMISFTAEDAASTVRAFGGRCEQLLFCSTVCTYGAKVPSHVLIDETFPQQPVTTYGRDKLACEQVFERAAAAGSFELTIARPSQTYGAGGALVDQLELDGIAWDRIERGLPVFCAGDGLGLWQATHRDDCAKFFAYAALNARTYGHAFNVTRDEVFTWRDYYRTAAAALDTRASLIFAPAQWLIAALPSRFSFLEDVTQFHGAYSSAKAKDAVPEFRCTIDFEQGARETLRDLKRRNAWRDGSNDVEYQSLIERALALGLSAQPA